ncbi:MAG: Do family serine endopeptidase [Hyphomicrobiales bacterium]|nr:Do family serine endopeptidase [Hyphomicrobiales bacterium]
MAGVALAAISGVIAETGILTPTPAFALAQDNAPAGPGSFAPIVKAVRGAVVSVKVKMVEKNVGFNMPNMPHFQPGDPMERFFRQFGQGGPMQPHPRTGIALGSGFIISADGYIVTNNHVVENATDVTVKFDDGRVLPARVVGTDKKTDLALLKIIKPGTYPFVQFAKKSPDVGDWVIAVGNPYGLGGTVTAGIVSARGRDINSGPYDDFLQIDAPINRGNSGGPTFNANGHVVGVNTAIFSPSGGSVGIGFAIPVEEARGVIAALEKGKHVVTRGWIGVQIQPVSADIAESLGLKSRDGALIAETEHGAPAEKAGLKSGDVITQVNGKAVANAHDLARTIAAMAPDTKVTIGYIRNGKNEVADLTLGTLPDNLQASLNPQVAAPPDEMKTYGLTLAPATSVAGAGKTGVVISDIDPNGVAAQKGLKSGDVILEAGGKTLNSIADLRQAFADARKAGRKAVLLRVKTGNGTRFVAMELHGEG